MHVTRRSLALLSSLYGGVTALLGVISFFGNGSFEDFTFRVGIAYFCLAGCSAIYLAAGVWRSVKEAVHDEPAQPDRVGTELAWTILQGLGCFLLIWVGGALVSGVNVGAGLRWGIETLGLFSVVLLPIVIVVEGKDVLAVLRDLIHPRRPCPRCGTLVKAGVKTCPDCSFDLIHPRRPCPRCDTPVKAGVMTCPNCSFDFSKM